MLLMSSNVEKIRDFVSRNLLRREEAMEGLKPAPAHMVEGLVRDLESPDARVSIDKDPYWPKWISPWWKMVLLHEMGMTHRIPVKTAEYLIEGIKNNYLSYFPVREEDLPRDCDPYRDILCHCAIGTITGLFWAMGIQVKKKIPWLEDWFVKYQLPDGGYNCDEQVYARDVPRSSFLSTLPPIEAILYFRQNLDDRHLKVLKNGADYLIRRHLCRSLCKGMSVIKPGWFRPVFPRYYDYDVLRGITFLTRWAGKCNGHIPGESLEESLTMLEFQLDEGGRIIPRHSTLRKEGTLEYQGNDTWSFAQGAAVFPLLAEVSDNRKPNYYLTREWYDTLDGLRDLIENHQIT